MSVTVLFSTCPSVDSSGQILLTYHDDIKSNANLYSAVYRKRIRLFKMRQAFILKSRLSNIYVMNSLSNLNETYRE